MSEIEYRERMPCMLTDEIIDHAVGLGMARIEAVELSIGNNIETGELLRFQHHHDGVPKRHARGIAKKPTRCRVTADNCGLNGHSTF